ncbi:hypothetical protein ACLB2K_027172 [Fragaria x ananassa]
MQMVEVGHVSHRNRQHAGEVVVVEVENTEVSEVGELRRERAVEDVVGEVEEAERRACPVISPSQTPSGSSTPSTPSPTPSALMSSPVYKEPGGWIIGVDYNQWPSPKEVHVGDTLSFSYNHYHNVFEVTEQGIKSCNSRSRFGLAFPSPDGSVSSLSSAPSGFSTPSTPSPTPSGLTSPSTPHPKERPPHLVATTINAPKLASDNVFVSTFRELLNFG